jgi:hypothetical protein
MTTTTKVTRQDTDRATDKRSIETIFILEDTRSTDEDGRPCYVFLSLHTGHDSGRKHYRTTVTRQYRSGIMNRWAMSLDLYGEDRQPAPDHSVAVARHSERALRAAHDEAVALYVQPATFDALIEWAERAPRD